MHLFVITRSTPFWDVIQFIIESFIWYIFHVIPAYMLAITVPNLFLPPPPSIQPSPPSVSPSVPPSHPEKPPAKPPGKQVERAKVLFNYTAEQPDELSIKVGEVLEVVSKDVQEGWWEVGGV